MNRTNIIKPDYYDDFYCIGSECRHDCCGGWDITMSKDEYRRLKKTLDEPSVLGKLPEEKRRHGQYAEFRRNDANKCPLQNEDGLCSLQLARGEKALTRTCTTFPRKGMQVGRVVFASLSPCCEKVLSLLMEKKESIQLIKERIEIPKNLPVEVLADKRKGNILDDYVDLYQFSVLILQAEDVSLEDRLILLGLGLHRAQELADEQKFDEIPAYLESYMMSLEQVDRIEELIPDIEPNAAVLMSQLLDTGMAPTSDIEHYRELLDKVQAALQVKKEQTEPGKVTYTFSMDQYRKCREKFQEVFRERELFLENLLVAAASFKGFPLSASLGLSVWDNYLYLIWLYSSLKFVLTSCIETIQSDADIFEICVTLLRSWVHNPEFAQNAVKKFHAVGSDTLAHMALLLKSC